MNQASQIPEKVLLAAVRGKLIQASLRRLIRWVSKVVPLPFGFLVETGCLERPAHAYCIWHSANLAKSLGYTSIGIAEFGVAAGATLLIIERYAKEVARVTGVDIRVYGFDTGAGLPKLAGVKDLPHWFRANMYTMDVGRLRERLDPRTTLVLGNVTDTVSEFFDEPRPPLAALFMDLDFFSSTQEALKILRHEAGRFAPRVFIYFDDVVGSPVEMYGPFNGELAAIDDFNAGGDDRKIHLNRNLLPFSDLYWRYQVFYGHLFDHPMYERYVGETGQRDIEHSLALERVIAPNAKS